jgi:hypothetical protein
MGGFERALVCHKHGDRWQASTYRYIIECVNENYCCHNAAQKKADFAAADA